MEKYSHSIHYQQAQELVHEAYLRSTEGRYEESITMLRIAKNDFHNLGAYDAMLNSHILLAKDFFNIGDLKTAFQLVNEYESLCTRHQVNPDLTKLFPMLGLLYRYRQDFKKAKNYFREAYLLALKQYDYATAAYCLNLYADLSLADEQFHETLAATDLAIECSKRCPVSLPVDLCSAKNIKIRAYLAQGALANAKTIFESINGRDFYHSATKQLAITYNLYSMYYEQLKEYEQAFRMQKQAVRLVRESHMKDYEFAANLLEHQLQLAKKLAQPTKILATYEEYVSTLQALLDYNANEEFARATATQQMAEIKQQAERDYLTGVYNRRYLDEVAEQWAQQAVNSNKTITVAVFDIDKFKRINDTYGHLAGDAIIQALAKKCSQNVIAETTLVARYGGDEFVVVFQRRTPDEAVEQAQILFQQLCGLQVTYQDIVIDISISMGVAHTTDTATSFKHIFEQADNALYASKENGRGRLTVAT